MQRLMERTKLEINNLVVDIRLKFKMFLTASTLPVVAAQRGSVCVGANLAKTSIKLQTIETR